MNGTALIRIIASYQPPTLNSTFKINKNDNINVVKS